MIGGTCKRSNAFSGPVLIARGLDFELVSSLWSFEGARAPLPGGCRLLDNLGGHSGGGTPLPIPNREVKPVRADGTWGESPWESRSPPSLCARRESAGADSVRGTPLKRAASRPSPRCLSERESAGADSVARNTPKRAAGAALAALQGSRSVLRYGGPFTTPDLAGALLAARAAGASRTCARGDPRGRKG